MGGSNRPSQEKGQHHTSLCRLNAVTHMDAYPMPRIDDLIDRLGGARFITTLDLAKGYWQVPVRREDRPKTAFATAHGLYQFCVMPFGLQGAPATFQRMMDSLLRGLDSYAAAYLDDVIIHSGSWEEHLQHIDAVLTRLRNANLTVKPPKCQFAMQNCTYLGHVVGNGYVQPESPILHSPDFAKEFILQTDASDSGFAYYSRKLLPREEKYAAVEKECLAIKVAVKFFKVYLLGRPFKIQTDHRVLEWLAHVHEKNARLTCWSLALQPYNYTIIYCKGTANRNADGLSRAFDAKPTQVSQGKGGGVSGVRM